MRARPELAAASAGAVVLTGVQGIVPALPDLQRDLQLSDTGVSIMMLGYLLAAMISAFPAGVLADRFGNRAVMVTSLLVFAAAGVAAIFGPGTNIPDAAREVLRLIRARKSGGDGSMAAE